MKACGDNPPRFLTLSLDIGNWPVSRSGHLKPEERSTWNFFKRCWVAPQLLEVW